MLEQRRNKKCIGLSIINITTTTDDLFDLLVTIDMDNVDNVKFDYNLTNASWLYDCKVRWNLDIFKYMIGDVNYAFLRKRKVLLKYMEEYTNEHLTDYSGNEKVVTLIYIVRLKQNFDMSISGITKEETSKLWFGFNFNNSIYSKEFWNNKLIK